jgi:hypothetical protein
MLVVQSMAGSLVVFREPQLSIATDLAFLEVARRSISPLISDDGEQEGKT